MVRPYHLDLLPSYPKLLDEFPIETLYSVSADNRDSGWIDGLGSFCLFRLIEFEKTIQRPLLKLLRPHMLDLFF